MKRSLLILVILTTVLTGCDLAEAQLVEAETARTEAQTAQADEQSDAETTAELTRIVNRLIDELVEDKDARDATITELIGVLKAREARPVYTAVATALLVAVGGVLVYRQDRRRREDIILLARLMSGNDSAQRRLEQHLYLDIPIVDITQEVKR